MESGTRIVARGRLLRLWLGLAVLMAIAGAGSDFSSAFSPSVLSPSAREPRPPQLVSQDDPRTPRHKSLAIETRPTVFDSLSLIDSEFADAVASRPEIAPRLSPFPIHLVSSLTAPTLPPIPEEPRRVTIGNDHGQAMVGRVYGGSDSRVVMMPDGSLGWPNAMIFTDAPFVPLSRNELREQLATGPYRHFQVHETDHYVIFFQSTPQFAKVSGIILESLYQGLLKAFSERGLDVHESEFPLTAVIFRNESDFREHYPVAPDVQAYYEAISNRIFLFETRDRDLESPEIAARRKPQTVAHEGTHQVLANIGVQPRLADWPIWLAEGLAEFCAPATTNRGAWAGFNHVNPFHMATLHDLEDSLAIQGRQTRLSRSRIGQIPGRSTVEYLLNRGELTPTDYALAWGLTHFLANRRHDDFVGYLRTMSQMPPLTRLSNDEQIAQFRKAFGDDLPALSQQAHRYLAGLKRPESLPFYAVLFEQPVEPGVVRRGTLVSQSPLVVRQWLDTMASSHAGQYQWYLRPFSTRSAASQATDSWIEGR